MTLYVGQRIGDYRLTRKLGGGGFADVYLGEHIYLHTEDHPYLVAVKVLHSMGNEFTPEEIKLFLNEAQVIHRLVHPHIVHLLGFSIAEVQGQSIPFLVMPYAQHGSLESHHPRGTKLPLDIITRYVRQVTEALQSAHDHNIVHRDIKPANFLLGDNGEVLLSDFGIAILAHRTYSWVEQNVAGTAIYMAPEQFHAKAVPASDQYSLGIVVYEWLCGTPPFTGNFLQLSYQHNFVSPPLLHEKLPSISSEVEKVVMKALAKDPGQRWPSVQTFALALEQAYQPRPLLGATLLTYEGHDGVVLDVVWSPDGTRLASASGDKTVQVWDALTGRHVFTYCGHSEPVHAVAWSLDGTRLASTSEDKTVQIWNASNGEKLFTCDGHYDHVLDVTWSPNGKYIASIDAANSAVIWEVATGHLFTFYNGQLCWVRAIAWSPDGTRIASAFHKELISESTFDTISTVRVWDAPTIKNNKYTMGSDDSYYRGHFDQVLSLAWSPDGQWIASSDDKTIRVWNASTHQTTVIYRNHANTVWAVAWSPDGTRITSASWDKTVQIWDALTGKHIFTYLGHSGSIYGVAWSPDGTRIASCSADKSVQVWAVT